MNTKPARRSPRFAAACALSALGLLAVASALAGPLNPPSGSVTSTLKPLSEVEPRRAINATNTPGDADSIFRIISSGSYYLTGNINVTSGQAGIEIAASNVTIDLMGFTIAPALLAEGTLDGIVENTTFLHTNIVIMNGSISGMGGNGIFLGDSSNSHRVERVTASNNGSIGIRFGDNGIIDSCQVFANGSSGITCFGANGVIRSCTASNNGSSGIILTSTGSVIDCASSNNIAVGFRAGPGASLRSCTARGNGSDGFDIASTSIIDSCAAYLNAGDGIDAALNCTITKCTVGLNTGDGILSAGSGNISGCSVYGNAGDGIEVSGDSLIEHNICDNNGNGGDGAGIHVTSSDNRVHDNHCTDNDRGIDIDAAGNLIIRNTCAGNAVAWDIAANNVFGPIIDRRAPASVAVVGFSAASTLGSTDPNANFSY